MRVLFIGGTGVISAEVSRRAVELGHEVYLLNRGTQTRGLAPEGAILLKGDARDPESLRAALGSRSFDAVADFISFTPAQLAASLEALRGRYGQYLFISSTAVYQRGLINGTEDAPLTNLAWDYSRDKIGCEQLLAVEDDLYGCCYTIVRPSVTYGDTRIPAALISNRQWSFADRILRGAPIVMQDHGEAETMITHSSDFAKGFCGLLGNPLARRQAYHIVSEEHFTWRRIAEMVGEALGREPVFAFIPSRDICREMPMTQQGATYGVLLCNKSVTGLYSNAKIRAHVPEFVCTTPFETGIRRTIEFFRTHPSFAGIDEEWNRQMDHLIEKFAPRPQP